MLKLRQSLVDETEIYGYDRDQLTSEQGRTVWQGTMDVSGAKNEQTTTLFPLRDALKSKDQGVYLVIARDAAMRELDTQWPQYGLAAHKGYPTAAHLAALEVHGVQAFHRRSFAPVRKQLERRDD